MESAPKSSPGDDFLLWSLLSEFPHAIEPRQGGEAQGRSTQCILLCRIFMTALHQGMHSTTFSHIADVISGPKS